MVLDWARYESLAAELDPGGSHRVTARLADDTARVRIDRYDGVLTRTMPVGSLEQITLRLNTLHELRARGLSIVNSPRGLEWAIDKYRTLARVAALGYAIPPTRVVQSRREAMEAFDELGGDVVAKPVFGGEGRGVMRVSDRELAWFSFATLERIGAVIYLQQFVAPGGIDTRVLVLGERVFAVRRWAVQGWKTNVSQGGRCEPVQVAAELRDAARRIAAAFDLSIAAVDWIVGHDEVPRVLEVNAVPGWKGAEAALGEPLAESMLALFRGRAEPSPAEQSSCPS
jgi:ribosomal protein S6--L-glutamate ligase